MEKTYCYETHLHTKEVSACASCLAADYVEIYKGLGYSGIVVTDHFLRGNSNIPWDLPWEEQINRYCMGYENAKKAGDELDFQVFFGVELNFAGDEFLLYGLSKEWLLANPDLLSWNHRQLLHKVHAAGGCVVQAHPFRERNYISQISLHPYVDAIEVNNNGNEAYQDALAYHYAELFGKPMTSGSDIHHKQASYNHLKGICFDKPVANSLDFAKKIKEGTSFVPRLEPERIQYEKIQFCQSPIHLYNEYGHVKIMPEKTPVKNLFYEISNNNHII